MGWSNGFAEWVENDTAFLSVVFSWRLPDAFQRSIWYKAQGYRVRAGGPATWAPSNKRYLQSVAEIGGEIHEAVLHHNSKATFASRGCPVGCSFCIVPKMEGLTYTLMPDFVPRPILCDNNLSGLPVDYQEHIIRRYAETETILEDANSGFEPRTFDGDTFARWEPLLKPKQAPWRFAFDAMNEEKEVQAMMKILTVVPEYRKRVYVLIGNEPIEQCYYRIRKVIEWGGQPHCQPMMALNALEKRPMIRFDWTEQKLIDMARWANRFIWRKTPLQEYRPRINQRAIFAEL